MEAYVEKKITRKVTLGLIEDIVNIKLNSRTGPFSALEYLPIEGLLPNFGDQEYLEMVKARLLDRLNNVKTAKVSKLEEASKQLKKLKRNLND